MPKKGFGSLKLDLLKPQSAHPKIFISLIKWVLSAGRYLIVIVEIIVLTAFIARFKLDNDIADTKEAIDGQVPFLESLKPDEILIRKTQFQITTLKDLKTKRSDFTSILDKLSAKLPSGIILNSLNIEEAEGKNKFKIVGSSQNNDQLTVFISSLKADATFSDVNITSISIEQGKVNFTLNFASSGGGQNI